MLSSLKKKAALGLYHAHFGFLLYKPSRARANGMVVALHHWRKWQLVVPYVRIPSSKRNHYNTLVSFFSKGPGVN
jgi:hypothetical protein